MVQPDSRLIHDEQLRGVEHCLRDTTVDAYRVVQVWVDLKIPGQVVCLCQTARICATNPMLIDYGKGRFPAYPVNSM